MLKRTVMFLLPTLYTMSNAYTPRSAIPFLRRCALSHPHHITHFCISETNSRHSSSSSLTAVDSDSETSMSPDTSMDFTNVEIKSKFLKVMRERGYLYQCTDISSLDDMLSDEGGGSVKAYIGFDATAPSLHVGSLLQIMILRHYQRSGGTPYVLIGGGTSAIGDPTGKDQSRKMLNAEDIRRNTEGICGVFEKFLEFGEGEGQAKMVDNSDWLSGLNYMNFLRDYGPMFTVNRMLSFESVKQRLAREAPLSFLEFNYMILQSYDFLELYRRHNVTLQLGGSDQWGNMVSGVDLIRKCKQTKTFALTAPLVTTASGKKMGKTEGGAVWLNKSQLSEFQYWQFWRNTDDGDVGKFLRLFTDLPMDEIERLELLEGKDINKAKEVLADEATAMLHGRDCLDGIHSSLQGMFGSSSSSSSSPDASAIDATGLPSISVAQPTKLIDALILLSFASSKKESRRLIEGGGAKVDGIKVQDTMHVIEFEGKEEVVIGAGKKRAGVLRLEK